MTDYALFVVQYALYFDAWRWCIFFALFVPIYWLSRLIMHVLVLIVEARLFSNAKILYFMISVRVRSPPPPPGVSERRPHPVLCR